MAIAQEKVDMSVLKDTFLECPVCVEHFNQTNRLPHLLTTCLHAFCTQCLQQLLEKEGKGQITCPLCRQIHNVPGKANSLPVDPVRAKLVEFVQMKNEGIVPCADCPDGNTAESRCQECSSYLCKQCTYVHKRHQLTHDHQIISLSDALQQPLNMLGKRHCCTHHPKHQLEFFCATDDTLCCMSCTVLEHKGHEFQKLEDVAKKRKEELGSLMQAVHRNAQQLRQRRMREEKGQKAIAQAQTIARFDIHIYVDNMTSILNKRKTRLIKDVNQRSETKLALSRKEVEAIDNTLAVMDSAETYFTQARDKADVVELLQMYPAIKRSLEASADGQGQGQSKAIESAVTFSASNGKLVKKLLSEAGYVGENTDAQKEKKQLLLCFDEVVDATLNYMSKNELIKHLQEKASTTNKSSTTYTRWPFVNRTQGKNFFDPPNTVRPRQNGGVISKDPDNTCNICMAKITNPKTLDRCGHTFCVDCIYRAFSIKRACPECGQSYDVVCGSQIRGGKMTHVTYIGEVLPGYEDSGGITVISYDCPGCLRSVNRSPSRPFDGMSEKAYLPYNDEGREVLQLLYKAFEAGLTFTFVHTGWSSVIALNIPHKTSKTGDSGYPDPDYLKRVKMDLYLKGIKTPPP